MDRWSLSSFRDALRGWNWEITRDALAKLASLRPASPSCDSECDPNRSRTDESAPLYDTRERAASRFFSLRCQRPSAGFIEPYLKLVTPGRGACAAQLTCLLEFLDPHVYQGDLIPCEQERERCLLESTPDLTEPSP